MNKFISSLLLLLTLSLCFASGQGTSDNSNIRIDSLIIRKNWRTKEYIIQRELGILPGEMVSAKQLEMSISRIWNIGNFSKVYYTIDSLENNKVLLTIVAQDALTVMPILTFSGNREEYTVSAGIVDNNLLGKNIRLGLDGSFGTNVKSGNFNIGIPRQLLFRNMTLNSGFSFGQSKNYIYNNDTITSAVAYDRQNISVSIGNPYHTDYYYTFSPDLSIGYFRHKAQGNLLEEGTPHPDDYTVNYLTVSTGESVGLKNRIRHQEDGYTVGVGIGFGIGLDENSPGYLSAGINGSWSELLNKYIQLDFSFSTSYTTAEKQSMIHYLGPGHVKGILSGEKAGKAIWSSNADIAITYINIDWLSIEQTFFINSGNAGNIYWDIFSTRPLTSAGTKIRFSLPMIPWMAINLFYAYRGNNKHWYSIDF